MLKKLSLPVLVIAALIVFALAVGAMRVALPAAGIDATDNDLFTISDGTKDILKGLDEPVTVRLYYSSGLGRQAPFFASYAGRVKDLLREYERLAQGNLRVQFLDPEPFSDIEDEALAAGLQGAALNAGGEKVYFGLVATNSTDGREVIEFFQPEREAYLEYDITRAISSLSSTGKKVLGVLSSLPVEGGVDELFMTGMGGQLPEPWVFYQQLQQQFEVVSIDRTLKTIPANVEALLVVQPDGLALSALYALDQYVVGGGKALVFTDIHPEGNASPPTDAAPDVWKKILSSWGVVQRKNVFAADYRYGRRVSVPMQDGRQADIQYLPWLALDSSAMNSDDILTSDIEVLNIASAGILQPAKDTAMTLEPLFTTSKEAAAMNVSYLQGQPNPIQLLNDFAPTGREYWLALRASGKVTSAFGEKQPAFKEDAGSDDGDEKPQPLPDHRAAGDKPANLVVVADTDMLRDGLWVQVGNFMGQKVGIPNANNGSFVQNAVDNLMGSNALISLRSRGVSSRPLTVLEDLRRDAEARFREQEEILRSEVATTESKLNELTRTSDGATGALLTPEQEKVIADYQQQLVEVRKKLRSVQRSLRQDIEALQNKAIALNVLVMPLLVIVFGFWWARRRRRIQRSV